MPQAWPVTELNKSPEAQLAALAELALKPSKVMNKKENKNNVYFENSFLNCNSLE